MATSIRVFLQKFGSVNFSKKVSYHEVVLKGTLLIFSILCFVTSGLAQSGSIQFSQASYVVSETDGTVTLEIQRVGGSAGVLNADIQTFDGTATVGDDYAGIPSPLTLTWSDGNTSPKTVTLPIKVDTIEEGPETFTMTLTGSNIGTPGTATVTITNVSPGAIQFSQASYTVAETDGTVTLEIQRVGGSIGELTATIQTFDGTATIVDDYAGIPSPLTLTWANGNTSPKTVTLPIKTDNLLEGNETFTMTITSANAGVPATATVNIIDVPPGTIQFTSPTYSVNESDGTVTLELIRVGGSIGEITAAIQTFDGTATIVDDYAGIPSPLTLTWANGNTSPKTVTLPIKEDVQIEGNENFTMTITSTNPDWVGTPSTAIIEIIDNDTIPGCDFVVTANAGADQTVCGDAAVAISATASGPGMWSGGLGSFGNASMTSTTYVPDSSELGTVVSLTWTTADPDGTGPCIAVSDTVDITFDEEPNAGMDNATSVCAGTIVDLSSLVSEPGGTFSGSGASGNSFDTTGLAAGDYPITYTVNSGNSCPDDTALITVTVIDDTVVQSCEVLDIDYCNPAAGPFYNFFWDEMQTVGPDSEFFSQNATHTLTFTEFSDGTALIEGSTQSGTCSAQLYIVLKDKKDWTAWSAGGGGFKPQGCDPGSLVKEAMRYYVVDGTKSTITTTGGDCLEEGTFIVTQRPDPNDLSTGNYGVHIGSGGALYDSDTAAEGLAGWAWMGPRGDEQKYIIDFNFHIDCEENTECRKEEEVCDGIDNDGDGEIDEDLPDSDNDGIPDGCDICEGGDDNIDTDGDGVPDACDKCDGDDSADADGDGVADACDICDGDDTADADGDGVPDACDVCDGDDTADADGDGVADACDICDGDDTSDADGDGVPDACDICDGDDTTDADGDGVPDACDICDGDDTADTDGDGVPDACDVCDGDDTADTDGDGVPDTCDICDGDDNTDTDGDGVPDACDICDGDDNTDTDGDGVPDACDVCDGDDNADADGDGIPDACDVCDGDDTTDTDGDGVPDACDICDGDDNTDTDGDGVPDACDICDGDDTADADGDGVPDACDICDGDDSADSDGDGVPDACDICDGDDNTDTDGDGVPDACDICDGDDNTDTDGDGVPDACDICDGDDNTDTDGDGVPDACDICDGDDNADADGDGVPDACDVCPDGDDTIDNNGNDIPDACEDAVPTGCETAFARYENSNSCFIDDGFNRWGWTNFLATPGNYSMDLYSAAGQCVISDDRRTGNVTVNYESGSITVTIELLQGFIMKEAHLYVGNAAYPVNGNKNTVAPGQYPYNSGDLNDVTSYTFGPIDISNLDNGIYMIVHAVTCETTVIKAPVSTSVKTYHVPLENTVNLEIDIRYDAAIEVQFLDLSGKMVMKKNAGKVSSGRNVLPLRIHDLATGVHILSIDTGKEVISKKVYFYK